MYLSDPSGTKIETEKMATGEVASSPTAEEIGVLNFWERLAFRVADRMNRGRIKNFWTFCQRTLGAGWIQLATYNIMRVHGMEHVEAASRERPLLLVANHRSFFDMYVVSAMIFRQTTWHKTLYFPVRGRFFYESPLGMLVNFIMGWWSMYPPIFMTPEKRAFDKYSLRRLTELTREGRGHIIGFHPEGTRNKSADPYSFLRPQPGVGRLIKEAQPQVIPVFVAGLKNSLPRQIRSNWTRDQLIRIHFGPQIDFSSFQDQRDGVRAYKEIADLVMERIAALAESDRSLYGGER